MNKWFKLRFTLIYTIQIELLDLFSIHLTRKKKKTVFFCFAHVLHDDTGSAALRNTDLTEIVKHQIVLFFFFSIVALFVPQICYITATNTLAHMHTCLRTVFIQTTKCQSVFFRSCATIAFRRIANC